MSTNHVPNSETEFFRQLDREELVCDVNNEIALYRNTGDARHFWMALVALHEGKEPIPPDFIAKLAEWGRLVQPLSSPSEIARALELSGDRRSHVGPKQSQAYYKRWRLASDVQSARRALGGTWASAFAVVAKKTGYSIAKVKKDYHAVFTAPDSQKNRARRSTSRALENAWKKSTGG